MAGEGLTLTQIMELVGGPSLPEGASAFKNDRERRKAWEANVEHVEGFTRRGREPWALGRYGDPREGK